MSRAEPLAIPRRQWIGLFLDRCRGLPGIGRWCGKIQRVRRRRFLARIQSSGRDDLIRELLRHAEGSEFQSALGDWSCRPSPAVVLPALPPLEEATRRCSVIINTIDRAGDLALTLEALGTEWDDARDELIVVLGPTTDDSLEVIRQAGISCQLIHAPKRNLAISRNLGWQAAKGRFVVFLDDDASPAQGWLDALLEPLERDSGADIAAGFVLDATGGRFLNRYVVADTLGRAFWFEDNHAARAKIDELGAHRAFLTATGCNMAFKRSVLETTGGFDPFYRYFLEETDIVRRALAAGFLCVGVPGSRVRHRLGNNLARTPSFLLEDRLILIRSLSHYIGKFGKSTFAQLEIEACLWERVLRDLEKIAWDGAQSGGRQTSSAELQKSYLRAVAEDLRIN